MCKTSRASTDRVTSRTNEYHTNTPASLSRLKLRGLSSANSVSSDRFMNEWYVLRTLQEGLRSIRHRKRLVPGKQHEYVTPETFLQGITGAVSSSCCGKWSIKFSVTSSVYPWGQAEEFRCESSVISRLNPTFFILSCPIKSRINI